MLTVENYLSRAVAENLTPQDFVNALAPFCFDYLNLLEWLIYKFMIEPHMTDENYLSEEHFYTPRLTGTFDALSEKNKSKAHHGIYLFLNVRRMLYQKESIPHGVDEFFRQDIFQEPTYANGYVSWAAIRKYILLLDEKNQLK